MSIHAKMYYGTVHVTVPTYVAMAMWVITHINQILYISPPQPTILPPIYVYKQLLVLDISVLLLFDKMKGNVMDDWTE